MTSPPTVPDKQLVRRVQHRGALQGGVFACLAAWWETHRSHQSMTLGLTATAFAAGVIITTLSFARTYTSARSGVREPAFWGTLWGFCLVLGAGGTIAFFWWR